MLLKVAPKCNTAAAEGFPRFVAQALRVHLFLFHKQIFPKALALHVLLQFQVGFGECPPAFPAMDPLVMDL